MIEEFYPLEHLRRFARWWWVCVLAALAGALAGYAFHLARPPLYEAQAIFYAAVDVNKMPGLDTVQWQYNEDLALSVVEFVMRHQNTLAWTSAGLEEQGIRIPPDELVRNVRIERRHAFWELGYRHPDPQTAQQAANEWAEVTYEVLEDLRSRGELLNYVVIEPPNPAILPDEPVLFERNRVMIAGSLLGFIASVLLLELWGQIRPAPAARSDQESLVA